MDSWVLSLRAERKSAATVKSYTDGVRAYLAAADGELLSRGSVGAWVAGLLDGGSQPATARARQLAVRRFSAWLAAEDEIPADELVGMAPPQLDTKHVPVLSTVQLQNLIAACKGPEFRDRRDEAIIRLMAETGARAGEVLGLAVTDVDLGQSVAVIRRGKGGKARTVPYGPRTAQAIDRYLRVRRRHRLASTATLWLGGGGKEFGYHALRATLNRRAARAGIGHLHPHMFRHTAADRWLSAGGSESGLMAVAGWSRPEMLMRYTRARAEQRAADEARRLGLGDI